MCARNQHVKWGSLSFCKVVSSISKRALYYYRGIQVFMHLVSASDCTFLTPACHGLLTLGGVFCVPSLGAPGPTLGPPINVKLTCICRLQWTACLQKINDVPTRWIGGNNIEMAEFSKGAFSDVAKAGEFLEAYNTRKRSLKKAIACVDDLQTYMRNINDIPNMFGGH
ncbi:uncharacterized protein LACBIDRAFT_333739 [Laccaria bicolor S238N-H82]|uniref:Predicted protein n=1 Tax=Laccaria bicolor (strain S238N-H82 / ATCC MYA-4686) TaxID=486041 RepID=B0DWW9_LACBS|nr:uncharacterized protein LACBIDRAFT_333739 [Laccaria bicolor S238N-H82]EDR00835.1 predicted protein [Laccaria bicolor S238N-H82]|eukprot:XP_001888429.1 predicted protein [Laccaria bicolor S238N-H82]